MRDPGQPTATEHTERMISHRPCRSWCKFCVMGLEMILGRGAPCVYGLWFLGEKESEEQVTLVLVIRERRNKMTWAMLLPREGTEFP